MESPATDQPRPRTVPDRKPTEHRKKLPVFDTQLIKAQREQIPYKFHLTDDEVVVAQVQSVDPYFIELRHPNWKNTQWINKAAIRRCYRVDSLQEDGLDF